MYSDADIADLITKAHLKQIKVFAAYGAPDWPSLGCGSASFPLQRMAEIISYNAANPSSRFDGVVLDIEPSGLPNAALLTQYQCFAQQAHMNSMTLAVAVRFGWKNFVTYNTVTQEFYKHVIDMLDVNEHLIVMGYRNFAGTSDPLSDGIIASDQDQIDYAHRQNKNYMVLAGLETSDPGTTGSADKETFFKSGQAVMNSVAITVLNKYPFFDGLGGFAIHNYGNAYLGGALSRWPAVNPNFPQGFDPSVEEVPTPAGAPVTVSPSFPVNGTTVSLTFPSVANVPAGYTYVTPFPPAYIGSLPSRYTMSGVLAFDISTSASFIGPVTVCFKNLNVDSATFSTLRVLHNTSAGYVDETILSGPSAPNSATRTICARVASFSPIVIANQARVRQNDEQRDEQRGHHDDTQGEGRKVDD
ncbi:MAG: hypothetical protein NVSMB6_24950 [Burkholderiaceae bacterium]